MKYVISATECKTKKEALKKIVVWDKNGELAENTKIYEVKGKSFKPVKEIVLK